LGIKVLEDP
jgi:hypothetical protein